jgi:hypothetical protein
MWGNKKSFVRGSLPAEKINVMEINPFLGEMSIR